MKSQILESDIYTADIGNDSSLYIIDELPPEDVATLQALNSREAGGIKTNLKKVLGTDGKTVERVVGQFYVGYGHKSIGDCGSTSIFLDNISILAAKTVQDWELYNGQETSTRYINLSSKGYVDPINTPASRAIIERWFEFFHEQLPLVIDFLKKEYPLPEGELEDRYDKAIRARALDIMRGYIPLATRTNTSWHTNLRQAHDKLVLMRYHPCSEMSELAKNMLSHLKVKYPNSFDHKEYEEQEEYRKHVGSHSAYQLGSEEPCEDFSYDANFRMDEYAKYRPLYLDNRPIKTEAPKFLKELGDIRFQGLMDWGSWKDLQRHRNGVNQPPLLTTNHGFNDWYVTSLPEFLQEKARLLIAEQTEAINKLDASATDKQYCIPQGYKVRFRFTCGLPSAIYVIELRSGTTVHPTARHMAHKMHHALKEVFPDLLLHSDMSPHQFDMKRGDHDIIKKQ